MANPYITNYPHDYCNTGCILYANGNFLLDPPKSKDIHIATLDDIDKLKEELILTNGRYDELVKAHNEMRVEMEALRFYFTNDWKKHKK